MGDGTRKSVSSLGRGRLSDHGDWDVPEPNADRIELCHGCCQQRPAAATSWSSGKLWEVLSLNLLSSPEPQTPKEHATFPRDQKGVMVLSLLSREEGDGAPELGTPNPVLCEASFVR